jgi:Ni/Co efflux regulator RcnB
MRTFALTALAASAVFLPAGGFAQTVPDGWEGVPDVPVRTASAPAGGQVAQMRAPGRGPAPVMRHGPRQEMRRDMRRIHVRTPGQGRRFTHIQRINRGGIVPSFWFGPQFVVRNWGGYGFPQPMHDRRWVRYYDDALLIDRSGRVHDGRYGMDWDRYGDDWDYDDRGIPVYSGDYDDDYRDGRDRYDDDDYDRDERYGRGDRRGPVYGGGHASPAPACPGPCRPGYGGAYGYGYGYGYGPMIVTETTTTTTTAPVVESRTYYEYERVKVRPKARRAAPRARCKCPAPHSGPHSVPYHAGERG